MDDYVRIARLEDLGPNGAAEFEHDGRIIALFLVGGEIFAIDGICPHQGGPLAQGLVEGTIVTCPWHGWQFDLRDGRNPTFRTVTQPCFEVRIDGEDILIKMP